MNEHGVEKIICCGGNDNNDALTAAALMNNNGMNSMWPMMSMMGGGMGGWMNNPFAYMMMMAMWRNGWGGMGDGYGFGGNNVAMEAIRTQLQENQNAQLLRDAIGDGFNRSDFALSQLSQNLNVDFNMLQKCCCDVQAAIQAVAGETKFSAERVINAANLGDLNIIQNLKDCCCSTQKEILKLGADLQLQNCKDTAELRGGQRDLGQAMTQGFAQTAYETKSQTCEIIRNQDNNTQKIIDTLNTHWKDEQAREIQDLKAKLSQREQTDILLARLKGNGCGCENMCGNGF